MERTQSRDDDPRNARLALLMWMAILRKHDPRNPATHCTESASIGELDIETHTASNPTTGEYIPPPPSQQTSHHITHCLTRPNQSPKSFTYTTRPNHIPKPTKIKIINNTWFCFFVFVCSKHIHANNPRIEGAEISHR